MKTSFLTTLFLLFGFLSLTAQQGAAQNNVDKALAEYFELPRESIFLHLNKSTYVVGENIWFKGYVYDRQKERPFGETSNIYVGIYDSIGNPIDKRLYLGLDGYMKGDIPIDSTFTSGTYYVRASTNWMRNFKEDDAYVQKIKILSDDVWKDRAADSQIYDVQFLPEGGNLVSGIVNSVGVKIIDGNGYGVKTADAIIMDDRGNRVTSFETSRFGHGKFEFTPKRNRAYRAFVDLQGSLSLHDLPKASSKGINISLKNNPRYDRVIVVLGINRETYRELGNRKFDLLVHKEEAVERLPVRFDPKTLRASFILEKEAFRAGVNTITLFDSTGAPILERLFFNDLGIDFQDVNVSIASSKKDSLTIVASSLAGRSNVSISVLPENTKSYGHTDNIFSNFYLKPYIKGFIEDPRYYFTNVSLKKKYELDLLMLTQGWSKYRWNDILNGPPEPNFVFEDGLMLTGTLNQPNLRTGDKVLLHSSKNHGTQIIDVSAEKSKFMVTEYFPEKEENIYVSFIDRKGVLSSPGIYLTLNENKFFDKIPYVWDEKGHASVLESQSYDLRDFIKDDSTISLDEVTVTEERKAPLAEKNIWVPPFLKNKVTEVDKNLALTFPSIIEVIRSKGYAVRENPGGTVNIRSRRGAGVLLVLDGVRQPNLNVLYQFPTTLIESFFIDRLNRYEGVAAGNREVIYLFSLRGKELNLSPGGDAERKGAYEFMIKGGFEKTKKFYNPKYATYFGKAFEHYGVVHWEPEVNLDTNGKATFKILNTGLDNISFFIEGMGEDGSLVSTVKTIYLDAARGLEKL
ncbi:MAG: hypothetical protein WBG90_22920 [Saonia sp.]